MEDNYTQQKLLYKVRVEKGKVYFWCVCGLSKKQPFCDSAHKTEGKVKSLKYIPTESTDVFFCGCKMTKHKPLCDGSHSIP